MSADVVPFQLKNDGRNDMWNPDWRITGDAAETMPATTAAARPADAEQHDRGQPQQPGHHGDREVGDALLERRVDHAADARDRRGQGEHTELDAQHRHAGRGRGDLRRPRRRRWRDPTPTGCRLRIRSTTIPTSSSTNIAKVRLLFRSNGPMTGRGMRPTRLHVAQPVPLEQHLVAQERQGQGGQGQRQAAQPQRGQRHDAAQGDGGRDGHDDGRQERPLVAVHEHPGGERGREHEGRLRQADHAAQPGDHDERQEDERQREPAWR